MKKFILSLLVTLPLLSYSFDNMTTIDYFHSTISKYVSKWSTNIDDMLCDTFGDSNTTCENLNLTEGTKKESLDAFFQTNKYLDETEDTYIRLRIGEYVQSKESNEFKLKLSAQLPLNRTKKSFKLFIKDVEARDVKNAIQNTLEEENYSASIGINYDAPQFHKLKSKYSIGFTGLHPYISGRYSFLLKTETWDIDTVETVRYASNNIFEEETNIYLDNYYDDSAFFRVQLHRKTETDVEGMDYGFIFQYYYNPTKKTGLKSTIAFLGNTKYKYPKDSNSYGGINNYFASLSWRENIGRKWFYYELRPTINFHKKHDYKVNYSLLLMFDFYFGKYH